MAMNRQMKRLLQRQGQLGPDGTPVAPTRQPPTPRPQQAPGTQRAGAREFLHDVRNELRRVAWPDRAEVLNYSTIVLVSLVVLIALIFALDFAFAKTILFLFET